MNATLPPLEQVDFEATLNMLWTEKTGQALVFPTDKETALSLLRMVDLTVNDEVLAYLENSRQFISPGQWEATDILHLFKICVGLRFYRQEPDSRFWALMNRYQRGNYHARQDGTIEALKAEASRFSVYQYLLMLRNLPTREQRDQVLAMALLKLESLGLSAID
jgi:hypothetical protein